MKKGAVSTVIREYLTMEVTISIIFVAFFGFGLIFRSIFEYLNHGIPIDVISLITATIYMVNFGLACVCLSFILGSVKTSPFILKNVKRFRIMGFCLFVNSIYDIVTNFWSLGEYSIVIFGIGEGSLDPVGGITGTMLFSVIISLFCFVLAEVFSKATKIKEENDLTV